MNGEEAVWLGLLQWPALIVTVIAAWMVSTDKPAKRRKGFYIFLLSNVLWIWWGWHAQAYALIVLQLFLSVSNFHGIYKNSVSRNSSNKNINKNLAAESKAAS